MNGCVYQTADGKCKKFTDGKHTSFCVKGPCEHETVWINVKERLPHAIGGESDDVLTLNRFGEYNLLFFDGTKWCRRNGEPYTTNPQFEIVYWMLPGAPDGFKPWRRDCHEEWVRDRQRDALLSSLRIKDGDEE